MGIRELRKKASELGVKYSGVRKAELAIAVAAAETAKAPQNQTPLYMGDGDRQIA